MTNSSIHVDLCTARNASNTDKSQQYTAVLTNGYTGHVPRAPGFFFLFEGPPTGCGEIIFLN